MTPSTAGGDNAPMELFAIEQEEEEMLCPIGGGVSAGTHLHTATQTKTRKRFYLLLLSCKNLGGYFISSIKYQTSIATESGVRLRERFVFFCY